MNQQSLFPEEPTPAPFQPTEVKRITFSGPYDRRALVIAQSFTAWEEWRKAHHTEYGAAFWIEEAGLRAFNAAAFEVVRL